MVCARPENRKLTDLSIKKGCWRQNVRATTVRRCPSKNTFPGGVEIGDHLCDKGYKGAICAVCGICYVVSARLSTHACY